MMLLFAARIFPNLVISRPGLANSLNIYNGAATDKSLHFMFWVAMIGVPIVLTYTVSIYYVFRGKVTLTEESDQAFAPMITTPESEWLETDGEGGLPPGRFPGSEHVVITVSC